MPSLGYDPRAQAAGDASADADALRRAMKGFGTDEAVLIRILSKPDPLQMALLRTTYNRRHNRDLIKDIKSETSRYFEDGLVALVQGPLMHDVHSVHDAIKGLGTKESVLNDVLLGRTNADMRAIKQAYHQTFNRTLEADVKGDLSMKTERLFSMVMAANRNEEYAPVIPAELDRDAIELHRAMDARVGTDQITVCSILSRGSDGQIRALAHHWQQKYHNTLEKVVESEFSGHMKDALLLLIRRACDRAMSDAVQLEDAMAGLGTKDVLLVQRVVRVHWESAHLDQVRRAYAHRYKKDLIQRVKGETSGHYQSLMVACLT
jgi:annexin A7/11